ncbi:MAG: bifunctional N(6)-L-threonylcarbamoyladenine synthase/serine/threonine protein kinase [Thermoplasmatales archaeon]
MIVLGIESTAHTASVGIVEDGNIVDFISDSYKPLKGGINPREAAAHHMKAFPRILALLLEKNKIDISEIDRISVATGPGLGPALKTGVELARFLSIKYGKQIVPVNHGVAHLEIARSMSKFEHPLFLYVSGGNTQIEIIGNGKYSILGETLDIGVGNFLDKLARDMGIPFPGAPKLEQIALKGKEIFDSPYTIRGMDVAYSGLYTHLRNMIGKKEDSDIAFNAQEYAFTALAEIVERGMAHFGLDEFAITGGVARNRRLRQILLQMAEHRGYSYFFPEDKFLSDNGAMIALAGFFSSNVMKAEEVRVDQYERIDSYEASWIGRRKVTPKAMQGGESVVSEIKFHGFDCILKVRKGKEYRNPELDSIINKSRVKKEVRLLHAIKEAGIKAPLVLYVDLDEASIVMTKIRGKSLSLMLDKPEFDRLVEESGRIVASMHEAGISHGDINAGNLIVDDGISIIDPSMGNTSPEIEDFGVDVHLMKESLSSLGKKWSFDNFLEGYAKFSKYDEVLNKVREIEGRRRYL